MGTYCTVFTRFKAFQLLLNNPSALLLDDHHDYLRRLKKSLFFFQDPREAGDGGRRGAVFAD